MRTKTSVHICLEYNVTKYVLLKALRD